MLSILSFAHVLVGEPAATSPEHALAARLFVYWISPSAFIAACTFGRAATRST
jgi:hypothetical protein